jgi:Putative GTPase activating protein for Arf
MSAIPSPAAEAAIKKLARVSGNTVCPNCGCIKKFGFGSVCMKYLTFICNNCKSSHQAYSHRVKSITMSSWTDAEVLQISSQGGNDRCRATWLATAPPIGSNGRPTEHDHIDTFKSRDTYENKRYYSSNSTNVVPQSTNKPQQAFQEPTHTQQRPTATAVVAPPVSAPISTPEIDFFAFDTSNDVSTSNTTTNKNNNNTSFFSEQVAAAPNNQFDAFSVASSSSNVAVLSKQQQQQQQQQQFDAFDISSTSAVNNSGTTISSPPFDPFDMQSNTSNTTFTQPQLQPTANSFDPFSAMGSSTTAATLSSSKTGMNRPAMNNVTISSTGTGLSMNGSLSNNFNNTNNMMMMSGMNNSMGGGVNSSMGMSSTANNTMFATNQMMNNNNNMVMTMNNHTPMYGMGQMNTHTNGSNNNSMMMMMGNNLVNNGMATGMMMNSNNINSNCMMMGNGVGGSGSISMNGNMISSNFGGIASTTSFMNNNTTNQQHQRKTNNNSSTTMSNGKPDPFANLGF